MAGPQLPADDLAKLTAAAQAIGGTTVQTFTDDMSSYVSAADLVVAMGGYNTVCDILSLAARAVVVPRVRPVAEQWIRAERMQALGFFTAVHPDGITADRLAAAIRTTLARPARRIPPEDVNLDGLPGLMTHLDRLYQDDAPAYVPVTARRANACSEAL
jgi:predicted glycosyltransferase